jgi:hypothetical protein
VLSKNYDLALAKASNYDGDSVKKVNRLFDKADVAMNRLSGAIRLGKQQKIKEVEITIKKYRGYNRIRNRVRLIDDSGRKLVIPADEIYIV